MEPLDERYAEAFRRAAEATRVAGAFADVHRAEDRKRRRHALVVAAAVVALVALLAARELGGTTRGTNLEVAEHTELELPLDEESSSTSTTTTTTTTSSSTVVATATTVPVTAAVLPTNQPAKPATKAATAPARTTTTVPPGRPAPPDAYLTSRTVASAVKAATGGQCWTPPGGAEQCRAAADYTGGPDVPAIAAQDEIEIRWDTAETPTKVVAVLRDPTTHETVAQLTCGGGNPCRMPVGAEPGEYWLYVESTWKQGWVGHSVDLHMQ